MWGKVLGRLVKVVVDIFVLSNPANTFSYGVLS
jgi:hypothetical protein